MGDRLLRIVVKGCQGLINKDTEHISELTDPVVAVFKDNDPRPILITPRIVNDLNPTFGEQSSYVDVSLSGGTLLTFQVWHQYVDEKKGEFLGELRLTADRLVGDTGRIIDLLQARIKEPNHQVKVLSETPGRTLGSIQVEYKLVPGEEPMDPLEATATRVLLGGLSILNGKNLLRRDTGADALSDPYVTVAFPTKRRILWRSPTCSCTLNPVWAEDASHAHVIEVCGQQDSHLYIEVCNENPRPERDSMLGVCEVKVSALNEGIQKLELHPRPNEEDGVVKKMVGRLGWVTVDWKPVGGLAELCRARQQAQRMGGDGVAKIAQWSPTELNEYLKSLRGGASQQQPTTTGGPEVQQQGPTPSPHQPQGSSTAPAASRIPMALDQITKFSPYYPHHNDTNALRSSAIQSYAAPAHPGATNNQQTYPPASTTNQPLYPPASTDNQRPPSGTFTGAPPPSALYPPSGHPTTATTMASDPRVATVEMTDLMPVRISHGTKFYDTQLHLDEPLSRLHAETEDVFLVHSAVQLFFHNGELKDPRLSLRRNGCLLLKGDPYIKLTMTAAKGQQRNLVFVFPDKREVALSVAELTTVRQVKELLCDEFCQERGLEELLDDAKEIRLLWRYNELNDKATLQYYNIPTNAKLNVARRPKFSFDQHRRDDDDGYAAEEMQRKQRTQPPVRSQPTYQSQASAPAAPTLSKRTNTADRERRDDRYAAPQRATNGEGHRTYDVAPRTGPNSASARAKSADIKRRTSPPQEPTRGAKQQLHSTRGQTGKSRTGDADPVASYAASHRPRGYYEAETAQDDPELATLRRTVRELEQQVRQQTTTTQTTALSEKDRVISKLERELSESEGRYRDALQRIAELESSVSRFHHLLNRATQLNVLN